MTRPRFWRGIYLILTGILLYNLLPLQAQAVNSPAALSPSNTALSSTPSPSQVKASLAGQHKVLVDGQDQATLKNLASNGATLLADYGSFSLWSVSDTIQKQAANQRGVQVRDDLDEITLRNGVINTRLSSVPAVPTNLRQSKVAANQLWMIQFAGPVKDEWVQNLNKLGIQLVSYIPANAYVIWGDGAALTALEQQAATDPVIQWTGPYHPAYRLHPNLQSGVEKKQLLDSQLVDVTVEFFSNSADVKTSVKNLLGLAGKIYRQPWNYGGLTDVSLQVPAGKLVEISGWPDVFNVEPWSAPQKRDEVQDQIVAGNLTTNAGLTVPVAPGYLAWLQSKGFTATPSDYPVVDIVDDGIDNGTDTPLHPDFYQSGDKNKPDRLVYNNNCTTDATADGQGGHGNLNAGIVGAYNDKTGSPFQDANGYSYGLGVSPYSRIAGTKIFRNSGSYDVSGCAGTDEGVVARSYNSGATITSDSWGADNGGAYDASSRAYDVLTRDASSATPGNQEMLHVFAAGNAGPNLGTVGSPASAKNVLTVGGTENVRDEGVADGCGVTNSNSANDVFIQGSRGPTADKRSKPDVVAPAIHVQGPASQDPTFDATGVCAMQNSKYYPPGQTFYTWSSGTSHSTPAVAGAASLIYSYYKRVMNPGHNPSPAMLKGLMVNGARYLNGNGFNDTLPSNNQGWGGANLAPLFDSSTQYCVLLDQTNLFTATGQEYSTNCTVADTNKPVRITLAYTDAPGPTTGNAYVNDLNLSVVANRQLYLGNVFNGAFSTTGGVADPRNNVESVFLPAGTSGPLLTKVTAANIAGDGVPGNASQLDQDFVLIISNAVPSNSGVVALTPGAVNFSDTPPNANNNGIIEPGETIKLNMALSNPGNLTATAISSSLQANTPGVTVLNGQSGYADIPAGATGSNQLPYTFSLASNFNCGSPISFTQFVTYSNNLVMSQTVTFPTGVANGRSLLTTYNATDIPKAIPDGNTAGVNSVMVTSTPGTVDQMRVKLNITHTWDGDLTVKLTSPSNTTITLVARRGGSGDNFTNTYLDDSATVAISSGTAPFTGTYRPEQALSAFKGQPITGNWTLNVSDAVNIDTGTLQGWSIDFFNTTYGCAPATPGPAATLQVSGYPSPVVVGTANQFTVTAKDAQGNTAVNYAGTITLSSSDPSATFVPASYTFQPSDFGVKTLTATLATAGTQSITATDNASPGITGSQTGIQVLNPPSVITPVGGSTPQSASTNKLFAQRLQAVVKNSDGISMTNQTVVFTAPGSGASGTFTGNNSTTITVQTNAQGIADAGQFLANGVGGDYQVTATVAGVANPAVFQLTNVPSACNAFQVSSPTDDSSGLECGTLSYALLQASGNQTITFNLPAGTNTITVTNMLPPVPQSVTIDGGSCTNGPAIIIKGSGATGSGLRLSGANTIMNLQVMGFPDQQVVTKGTGNKLGRCVVAKK